MMSPLASRIALLSLLSLVLMTTAACAAVAGIFKAGMWVGIVVAVILIGGAFALISQFRS